MGKAPTFSTDRREEGDDVRKSWPPAELSLLLLVVLLILGPAWIGLSERPSSSRTKPVDETADSADIEVLDTTASRMARTDASPFPNALTGASRLRAIGTVHVVPSKPTTASGKDKDDWSCCCCCC